MSVDQALQDDNPWHIGQEVRIVVGPFRDMVGRIDEIDTANKRVRVTINFLGRQTPVEVEFSDIIPEE